MTFLGLHRPRFPAAALAFVLASAFLAPQRALAQASADSSVSEGPVAKGPAGAPKTADSLAAVTGVRLETLGTRTRLIFAISEPTSARAYVLANPDRVVVDLPELDFQIDPQLGRAPSLGTDRGSTRQIRADRSAASALGGVVGSFRFGLFAPGKSRIVVDLLRPARVVSAGMGAGSNADAFVLELAETNAASFQAAVEAFEPAVAPPAAPIPLGKTGARPVVMIDPGHGGVDTGALARHGVEEKQITLAFALALAAKLEADGQVKVAMTRTQDIFVPLGERVRLARAAGSSLFVSIHADTISAAANVSGATVYTLSNKASDSEAARVANKENLADAAGGLESKQEVGAVDDILFDLARRETRAYSNVFARVLMKNWRGAAPLNKNPHRSAGFMVLKAPDVPSVLLELGYLSNGGDEAHLTNADWREKTAAAAARAIEAFFARRRPEPVSQEAAVPAAEATSVAAVSHK